MTITKIFIALIISAFIPQFIKLIRHSIEKKKFDWKHFLVTGGFPSSHSSAFASLTLGIFLMESFSISFLISLAILVLVMRDASGVRLSSGIQGKKINEIITLQKIKTSKIEEVLGHTNFQTISGAIIGILITLIVFIM